jgi:glycosyltransferase involved in cell wall biosynthesis
MGNSDAHAWILDALPHAHATVVLHEIVLHHMIANATIGRGDDQRYLDAMEAEAGPAGRMLAHGVIDGHIPSLWDVAPERYPLTGVILRHARSVIVHSRFAAAWVARRWPGMCLATIPMLSPPAAELPAEQLPGDPFPVIGVFGFVTAHKRLPSLMAAFSRVAARLPRARLLVVGAAPASLDPRRLAQAAEVPAEAIEIVGFAEGERFERLLRSVDIGVNLRHPTLGETSATVVRWLALGTPVVVSTGGWYDELPDDAVARVAPDADEVPLLAAVLERLAHDDALRARMGEAARRYAEVHLSPRSVVDAYLRFLLCPAGEAALTEGLIASLATRIQEIAPGEIAATGLTRGVAQAARRGGIV